MRRLAVVLTGAAGVVVLLVVLVWLLVAELADTAADGPTAPGPAAPDPSAPAPAELPDDAEPATLDRVVDGDTIRVSIDDPDHSIPVTPSVRVRLLNVDAPELAREGQPQECGAAEATRYVEDLLEPGEVVWLAQDRQDRDDYDRPLRYVFTAAGVDVQAGLVSAGLAEVIVIPPNARFADALADLEDEAQAAGLGIWGELCPS